MNWSRQIPLLIAGWMLLATPPLWANQLTPFSAEYALNRGNIPFGKVTITLTLDGEGSYSYRAHTTPVGIVAVFRDDEITELSKGHISNNDIIPSSYSYHHKKKKKPRKVDLSFNWQHNKVTNSSTHSTWSMPIPPGTQDKFSQQLALMIAVAKGDDRAEFKVADGGKLKTYRFISEGEESIKTKAGAFNALRLARQKNDRPSKATFWLSPDLKYLPIKIIRKNKDEPYIMELQSIQWK